MSDEFLDQVSYAHEKFREKGMLTWLYDEDRWPSGYGGGFVTKDPEFRMRFLVFSPEEIPEGVPEDRGRDAVSYTHLDVYKRQQQGSAAAFEILRRDFVLKRFGSFFRNLE